MAVEASSRDSALTAELRRIAHNPLFELSMSSRELFHSNFISWLIRNHQAAGQVLVGEAFGHPGDLQQRMQVDRERKHVDLHIHSLSGHDIWIELKIGAIPSRAQLIEYHQKLETTSSVQRFILLSLTPLKGLPEPWRAVGMSELADAYASASERVDDTFQRELVRQEAQLLRSLVSLGEAVDPLRAPGDPWAFPPAVQDIIDDVRASTIVQKLRVGLTLNHLRDAYPDRELESAAGLTNGTGLVECRRVLDDGRSVGWQLQGNQYRLFAESVRPTARGEVGKPLGVDPSNLHHISPWFDFSNASAIMPGLGLRGRAKGRGVFGQVFAYQYRQLPPETTNRQVLDLLSGETARLSALPA